MFYRKSMYSQLIVMKSIAIEFNYSNRIFSQFKLNYIIFQITLNSTKSCFFHQSMWSMMIIASKQQTEKNQLTPYSHIHEKQIPLPYRSDTS